MHARIFIAAVLFTVLCATASAAEPDLKAVTVDSQAAVRYLLSCRKANGAFGPLDQEYTDAAWNYPAVKALLLLGEQIPQPQQVLEHGLGYPSGHAGYAHWLMFHQAELEELLSPAKTTADPVHQPGVKLVHQGYEVQYYGSPLGVGGDWFFKLNAEDFRRQCRVATELGYYNLSSLYYTLEALKGQGRRAAEPQSLAAYITARQAPCGGFVDVRVADGAPKDSDAHLATTFHALAALRLLGVDLPRADACGRFVRACQTRAGGFLYHPDPALPGNYADVYYTWAGLSTLKLLAQKPGHAAACVRWINSLQNADGGFGDQPGWRSRLYSTHYAIDSLAKLGEDPRRAITAKTLPVPQQEAIPEGQFGIYQGLHKMPVCRPDDLAGLRGRGFNLLALKSDKFELVRPLRERIAADRMPMDAILCPEAYPHRAIGPGGVLLNHVGNFTLDPRWTDEQLGRWQAADQAGRASLPWAEYQKQVIAPARQLGSLVYPEQDFEMEYAYAAYDRGVHEADGYNAFLAGFNWSPRDFVRVFPWRERYLDQLTPVADADAHGDLPKWSPQLDHTRHLYLAKGPGYAEFLDAARNGRVVTVIWNAEGVASAATYYGPSAAVNYVRRHADQWRWWGERATVQQE